MKGPYSIPERAYRPSGGGEDLRVDAGGHKRLQARAVFVQVANRAVYHLSVGTDEIMDRGLNLGWLGFVQSHQEVGEAGPAMGRVQRDEAMDITLLVIVVAHEVLGSGIKPGENPPHAMRHDVGLGGGIASRARHLDGV